MNDQEQVEQLLARLLDAQKRQLLSPIEWHYRKVGDGEEFKQKRTYTGLSLQEIIYRLCDTSLENIIAKPISHEMSLDKRSLVVMSDTEFTGTDLSGVMYHFRQVDTSSTRDGEK